jgi:hypothetical protein
MKAIRMKEAVWAGVISGLIFMMLEMIMVPMFLDGSPRATPHDWGHHFRKGRFTSSGHL